MRRVLFVLSALALAACARSPETTTVAKFAGGSVRLVDVERAILDLPAEDRLEREVEILSLYREIARDSALTRILVAESRTRPARLGFYRAEKPDLWRREVVRIFTHEVIQQGRTPSVSLEEAESYYRGHPEMASQDGRRYLYHIFVRSGEGEDATTKLAFLEDLRSRALAGESFEALARRHSESETRALGGRLGWIDRGMLDPHLESAAFSLHKGQVSVPLAVAGGAVLLYAERAVDDKTFSFSEMQHVIHQRIADDKLEQMIDEFAANLQPPPDSYSLDDRELLEVLNGGDPEATVLGMLESTVNVARFMELVSVRRRGQPGSATAAEVAREYERLVREHLLFFEAVRSGFADRPASRSKVDHALYHHVLRPLAESRLRDRAMDTFNDDGLREFFEEHRDLYSNPPRFRLRALVVDRIVDPARQMRRLDRLRADLQAGLSTLEAAAEELGGRIDAIGWLDSQQLRQLYPKLNVYVVDLGAAGFTVPFRMGGTLQILQVLEWQETAPPEFEAVRISVMEGYLNERWEELRPQVVERILADAGFRFHERAVRRALRPSPLTGLEGS